MEACFQMVAQKKDFCADLNLWTQRVFDGESNQQETELFAHHLEECDSCSSRHRVQLEQFQRLDFKIDQAFFPLDRMIESIEEDHLVNGLGPKGEASNEGHPSLSFGPVDIVSKPQPLSISKQHSSQGSNSALSKNIISHRTLLPWGRLAAIVLIGVLTVWFFSLPDEQAAQTEFSQGSKQPKIEFSGAAPLLSYFDSESNKNIERSAVADEDLPWQCTIEVPQASEVQIKLPKGGELLLAENSSLQLDCQTTKVKFYSTADDTITPLCYLQSGRLELTQSSSSAVKLRTSHVEVSTQAAHLAIEHRELEGPLANVLSQSATVVACYSGKIELGSSGRLREGQATLFSGLEAWQFPSKEARRLFGCAPPWLGSSWFSSIEFRPAGSSTSIAFTQDSDQSSTASEPVHSVEQSALEPNKPSASGSAMELEPTQHNETNQQLDLPGGSLPRN